VAGTGSESCTMAGFGISGVELLDFVVRELISKVVLGK
jgi:hypothetical protein